jgi:translation initiation factor IF-2
MTEDIKVTRLSKAAREFNVGISTIVEFLHKKGFDLDPNPNTKLPHEAYILLVKEYSTDISVKKESEKLILKDLHRKKESVSIDDFSEKAENEDTDRDEDILVKDSSGIKTTVDIKTDIKKPDIKLVGKIDLEKTLKPKTEKPVLPAEEHEPKPSIPKVEVEKAEIQKAPVEQETTVTKPIVEEIKPKPVIDLHIVGKIDLDSIAKENAPVRKEKKKEEVEEKPKEKPKVAETEKIEEKGTLKYEEKLTAVEAGPSVTDLSIPEPSIDVPDLEDKIDEVLIPEPEEDIVALYKTDFKKLAGPRVVGRTPVVKPVVTDKKEKPGAKKVIKKRAIRTEVNEEEVQKQIKETLARLTTKGKSKGSRYRRDKREAISQKHREVVDKIEQDKNILKVTEFVSVNELASMMNVAVTEIISTSVSMLKQWLFLLMNLASKLNL